MKQWSGYLASNQVPYSMINRDIEKDIIPQAIEKTLGSFPTVHCKGDFLLAR
jgi:aryl-alcohol dehydrogenase-like predicted oxidoreductase